MTSFHPARASSEVPTFGSDLSLQHRLAIHMMKDHNPVSHSNLGMLKIQRQARTGRLIIVRRPLDVCRGRV